MRKTRSRQVRIDAAELAQNRVHPAHISNGEENRYRQQKSFMTFTKGLAHNRTNGLVGDENQPLQYRAAINSGRVNTFDQIDIGDRVDGKLTWHFHTFPEKGSNWQQHRRWEAPTAGYVYDLQGPDAQAVTMPPAPTILGSDGKVNPELVAEIAEVYWLSLLRDVPFESFDDKDGGVDETKVEAAVTYLKNLPFYKSAGTELKSGPGARLRTKKLSKQTVFRGQTPGEQVGPYLSQFMLLGNNHLGDVHKPENGHLMYGSIRADMRVRVATPCKDYMTHWDEWVDVQNGADVGGLQTYEPNEIKLSGKPSKGVVKPQQLTETGFRFITTPRDLATYVHFDALYEAYLNACIWLLNTKAPFDPRFSNVLANSKSTAGFALFGGPHILSLVTEVATRALKAVRYQKFNNHLRLRPEALAGRIAAASQSQLPDDVYPIVKKLETALGTVLLDRVSARNMEENSKGKNKNHLDPDRKHPVSGISAAPDLPLLPMAFPEGSPMHPTYGAGHATVAGACVTILKAFFDEDAILYKDMDGKLKFGDPGATDIDKYVAFAPNADGSALVDTKPRVPLTLGGELNKLAGNISIGRNMAGVHYYSDYIESMRMGEKVAEGILCEQGLAYRDTDEFSLTFKTFDAKQCVIDNNGNSNLIA